MTLVNTTSLLRACRDADRDYTPALSLCLALLVLLLLWPTAELSAQASWDGNRWFQVEVSLFTQEGQNAETEEQFSPSRLSLTYPRRLRRFESFAELLLVEELFAAAPLPSASVPANDDVDPAVPPLDLSLQRLINTGPLPQLQLLNFRLPDPDRDAYLLLPPDQSGFLETNRTLERSPEHRLLFHGVWRQPVLAASQASALLIEGGQRYDNQPELQGSLTVRFNEAQDRVVIDTNLWLVQYAMVKTDSRDWPQPPDLPSAVRPRLAPAETDTGFVINGIVEFIQSRDMRSNEFHYLDHPRLGMVVSVKPYQLPPPVEN